MFGSILKVAGDTTDIIGVTFNVSTRSVEPNRKPSAFGLSPDELRREMPQVYELLRTEIESLIIGYYHKLEKRYYQMLPLESPQIHSFVYTCSPDEIVAFAGLLDFLRTILNANLPVPSEELIISTVRCALKEMDGKQRDGFMIAVGKELSRLIKNDYDLLRSIIRKIAV